jgi:hypothetical protein
MGRRRRIQFVKFWGIAMRHSILATAFGVILSSGALLATTVQAQNAATPPQTATVIGKIESLVGNVTVKHATAVLVKAAVTSTDNDTGNVKVGDIVYQGDIIDVGADGKAGIAFTDGTAFSLSSNAHMVLDKYVYDPDGKSNETLFSLSKGAFTFIAGKVASTGDMRISTPVATMGIRGTAPHVEVSEDGTFKFSTLVEQDKNKAAEKAAPGQERRGAVEPSGQHRQIESAAAASQAEKEFDKRLTICRGC